MNKRNTRSAISALLILIGIIVSAQFEWSVVADEMNWARFDFFTDHHHTPPTPTLVINHKIGRAGSYFKVDGSNYPVLNTGIVTVNGHEIGIKGIDGSGSFSFELNTVNADNGIYVVKVTAAVGPLAAGESSDNADSVEDTSAETKFIVSAESSNVWPSAGTVEVFNVPKGTAVHLIYLPSILR